VLLKPLGQRDVVKVVEGVDGRAQPLVVFLLDEQVVQRLVDCLVVVVLRQQHINNINTKSGLMLQQIRRADSAKGGPRYINPHHFPPP